MDGSQQNDLDEYARYVIRHKARHLIGRYGFTPDDYEDLQQDMWLDLLTRLPKFDPTRASPKTFIARVVAHKISTIIRHRTQEKRDYRCQVCSLDDPIEGTEGAAIPREQAISQDEYDLRMGKHSRPEVERIDLRPDVASVLSELPPDLKDRAERLKHRSIADVARELGVPRSTLYDNEIKRLRRAFEDKGLREYL